MTRYHDTGGHRLRRALSQVGNGELRRQPRGTAIGQKAVILWQRHQPDHCAGLCGMGLETTTMGLYHKLAYVLGGTIHLPRNPELISGTVI